MSLHLMHLRTLLALLGPGSTVLHAAPRVDVPEGDTEIGIAPHRNLLFRKSSKEKVVVEGLGRSEVRKFLMLATGPEALSLDYQAGASFLGDMGDDLRFIKNSPFPPQSYQDRLRQYRKQSEILWSCLRYRVADTGERGLVLPRRQLNCHVERIDDNSAYASGGLCYFGIELGSRFQVTYEPNPECLSLASLRSKNITPGEFHVFSGYYIAGDASGTSLDLAPLESTRLRFTLEPWGDPLPLTMDVGTLSMRWPTEVGLDAHIGAPRIYFDSNGRPAVETGLFVNNRCAPVCREGNCTSRCDFPIALGAQNTLSRLDRGNPTLVDVWFTGGVIPAQWEGRLPGQHTLGYVNALQPGQKYRLEMDLSYPDTYFRIFRDGLKQYLIDLSSFNEGFNPAGLGHLPALTGLATPDASLPTLSPLPVLDGAGVYNVGLDGALQALQRLIKLESWPPYYERWCLNGRCPSILQRGENVFVLTLDFIVREMGRDTEALIENVTIRRRSSHGMGYERSATALPTIETREVEDPPFGQ